jgi:hypothetical protein
MALQKNINYQISEKHHLQQQSLNFSKMFKLRNFHSCCTLKDETI